MLVLANLAGWVLSHLRLIIVIAVTIAVLLTVAIIYSRCTRVKPMTPEQIEKAQRAIQNADREAMEKVFVEAAADEALADRTVEEAEATRTFEIEAAKKRAEQMTNAELAAELESRVQ